MLQFFHGLLHLNVQITFDVFGTGAETALVAQKPKPAWISLDLLLARG
jgi:hypothetical protein